MTHSTPSAQSSALDLDNEETLSCPFCNSRKISDGEVSTTDIAGETIVQSMCMDCGAAGPGGALEQGEIDYGDVKARAAWNRRATPAGIEAPTRWESRVNQDAIQFRADRDEAIKRSMGQEIAEWRATHPADPSGVASSEQQDLHVMPPTRGTDSLHSAWITTAEKVGNALNLAMEICDAIPSRLHKNEDSQLANIGMLVNAQDDGSHGYALIRNAQAAFAGWRAAPSDDIEANDDMNQSEVEAFQKYMASIKPIVNPEPLQVWLAASREGYSEGMQEAINLMSDEIRDAARWCAFRARDDLADLEYTAFQDQFREDADAIIDAAMKGSEMDIQSWQQRCDWESDEPAVKLMVKAMKAEIAELRAALASGFREGRNTQPESSESLATPIPTKGNADEGEGA